MSSHHVSNNCNIFFLFFFLLHTCQQGSGSAFQRIWYSSFFLLMPIPLSFHLPKDAHFLHIFLMLMCNHCQCSRSSSYTQLSWRPSAFGQIVFSPYLMFCGYLLTLKNRSDLAIINAAPMLSLGETDVQSLSVQLNECDEAFFFLDVMNYLVFLYYFSNEFPLIHKNNDTKYLSSPATYTNLPSPTTSSATIFHYIG